MRLLRIGLLLLAGIVVHTESLERRSLVSDPSISKRSEMVVVAEGSGDPKRGNPEGIDQEVTSEGGSGAPDPDTEPDDGAIHGSGNGPNGEIIEGSGSPAHVWQQPVPVITTSTTTTQSPLPTQPDVLIVERTTPEPAIRRHEEILPNQLTTRGPFDVQPPPPPHPTPSITQSSPIPTIPSTRRPTIPAAIPPDDDEPTPFHHMLKPGVFAAIVGGSIVGLLATVFIIVFIVYRMRKKDEGSYALDEPKARPYAGYAYTKASTKEFYA